MNIVTGDLSDPRIVNLVTLHHASAHAASPPKSAHALDLEGLASSDISVWAAWDGEVLMGVGALKALDPRHGEVKSMHTLAAMRGRGVGGALLRHIVGVARARGYARLSLETGSMDEFQAARALYGRHGFEACAPFASYRRDPNSVFMTLAL